MADRLFPHRARRIGSTGYGLDADYWDHRNDNPPSPELTVSEKPGPLVIWHPDGVRYRTVDEGAVEFGFHPKGSR